MNIQVQLSVAARRKAGTTSTDPPASLLPDSDEPLSALEACLLHVLHADPRLCRPDHWNRLLLLMAELDDALIAAEVSAAFADLERL